jgi:hypothetical protein
MKAQIILFIAFTFIQTISGHFWYLLDHTNTPINQFNDYIAPIDINGLDS